MKSRNLVDSFNHALMGIIEAVKREKNMRIHILAAIIVLTVCFFYDLSKVELLIITISISLVIVSEMINTAIEHTLDAVFKHYNPIVKVAKDIAAGAVLIAAVNSVLVGYIIFWDKLRPINFLLMDKIKNSNTYTVFLILLIVCIITLLMKLVYGEGTPFKGGMPSGHSTIAFSVATTIALLTDEPIGIVLGYLLAVIVAQSRVDTKTHSLFEVILGAVLGVLLTIILFKSLLYKC